MTKLFTIGDGTYIGTHRTVPISFVSDCKSDNSPCKFRQPLQSVTIAGTTIQLTNTRGGGVIEIDFIHPGEVIENRNQDN